MKIQLLSDLHYEFSFLKLKVHKEADVIVIAGDVTIPQKIDLLETLTKQSNIPILFVSGNHEYYSHPMQITTVEWTDDELKKLESKYSHFHYLHDKVKVIDGVTFIGSTLWSNFDLIEEGLSYVEFCRQIQRAITDFRRIWPNLHRGLTPEDIIEWNRVSRLFLEQAIKEAESDIVVITHFGCSKQSVHEKFEGSWVNPYFSCNCEDLMGGKVKLWLHGHTHESIDYTCKGTRVIANPRGYHTENKSFNNKLVIEI